MDPSVSYLSWGGERMLKGQEMKISHPFIDYQGVVMSNLDAVYNLSGHEGGAISYQTGGKYSFVFDGLSPGAAQYFFWRRPQSYAIWRVNADTNISGLDQINFTAVKDDFAPFVKEQFPWGVDAAISVTTSDTGKRLIQSVALGGKVALLYSKENYGLVKLHFKYIDIIKLASNGSNWVIGIEKVPDVGEMARPIREQTTSERPTINYDAHRAMILWNIPTILG